jgi:hypothetical protein
VDYKAFLSKTETLVLPYFGGTRVDTSDKRLRIDLDKSRVENLTPGWWQFQVEGRNAYPTERASPTDLSVLPAVRGHWVNGWVVIDGRSLARIAFPPDDEPAPLSRVTARRWYSHDLLFDSTDFEDDAELAARAALEDRRPLTDVKGVVPSLRTAFGIALGTQLARELDVDITPRELLGDAVRIADAGRETVRAMFQAILDERVRAAEEARRAAERAALERRLRIEEAEARERIAGVIVSARPLERGGRRPDAREGRAGRNRRKDNNDPARRADVRSIKQALACCRRVFSRAARRSTSRTRWTAPASSRCAMPRRCRSTIRASASRARTACSPSTRCPPSSGRRSRSRTSTSRGAHEGTFATAELAARTTRSLLPHRQGRRDPMVRRER